MKVGFCVEGSTDKWLLHGLRDRWKRWCSHIDLIEGRYRGSFKRREIPKACSELRSKGVDLIVLLRDANDEDWRSVVKGDREACKPADAHLVVVGVCDRNVECWMVADRQYAARQMGLPEADLNIKDPKGIFNGALGITHLDDKRNELIAYTINAPSHQAAMPDTLRARATCTASFGSGKPTRRNSYVLCWPYAKVFGRL